MSAPSLDTAKVFLIISLTLAVWNARFTIALRYIVYPATRRKEIGLLPKLYLATETSQIDRMALYSVGLEWFCLNLYAVTS